MDYKQKMKQEFTKGNTELGITYFWLDMGNRILDNEFDWIRVARRVH